jgi:DEAD/DEAH box helicase domain-containing protein
MLPAAALQALAPHELVAVPMLEANAAPDQDTLRLAWRRFLAIANLLQFLPCCAAVTAEGAKAGLYEQAGWTRLKAPAEGAAPPSAWQGVLDEAVADAQPGLRELMRRGQPVPIVGFELQDGAGAIVAEAELAWPEHRIAVLREDQTDFVSAFQGTGWTAVMLGADWAVHAGHRLGEKR